MLLHKYHNADVVTSMDIARSACWLGGIDILISVHVLHPGPSSPPLRLPSTFWYGRTWKWLWMAVLRLAQSIPTAPTTMAAQRYCPSYLTKASPTTLFRAATTPRALAPPSFLRPFHTSSPLAAVQSANAAKYKRKDANNQALASKKKKKTSTSYATPDLRDALQFSLVDAMRYVKTRRILLCNHKTSDMISLATCAPSK